jgi:hypothetical protein
VSRCERDIAWPVTGPTAAAGGLATTGADGLLDETRLEIALGPARVTRSGRASAWAAAAAGPAGGQTLWSERYRSCRAVSRLSRSRRGL